MYTHSVSESSICTLKYVHFDYSKKGKYPMQKGKYPMQEGKYPMQKGKYPMQKPCRNGLVSDGREKSQLMEEKNPN